MDNGLRLTKLHRGRRFAESHWMASYIERNTAMRAASQDEMERELDMLRNNALYWKRCENQGNRTDIRIFTDRKKIGQLGSQRHCLSMGAFDRNLVGVEHRKVKNVLTKPSFLGFAVLEFSKHHILLGEHPMIKF